MKLQPYIFFYGRCEEALQFYKNAIGGDYHLSRISESPMASQFPADFAGKVMHAAFEGPGFSFMASDGREAKAVDPDAGNITLSLSASDTAEGQRVFEALAQGGSIGVPFADAPWGEGKFGMVTDRFGTEWMITSE